MLRPDNRCAVERALDINSEEAFIQTYFSNVLSTQARKIWAAETSINITHNR